MHVTLHLTVVGTVFNPNPGKILALNRDLDQYAACLTWYLSFKSTSKAQLHNTAYQKAKNKFTLKTALLQSARDKVVEIYTSFQPVKATNSKIRLKQCCIRFDERSFAFEKAKTNLTPYWLHLSWSGQRGRTAVPLVFAPLQTCLEYKALQHGIRVRYINPKDTTQEYHRCGTLNQVETTREHHCFNPNCSMTYDRYLTPVLT